MRIFGMANIAGLLLAGSAAPAATWIAPPDGSVRTDVADARLAGNAANVFGAAPTAVPVDEAAIAAETSAEAQSLASLVAVPEVAVWLQLIIGTGLVGLAVRQRRSRRAEWRGLVARLSGRVREA